MIVRQKRETDRRYLLMDMMELVKTRRSVRSFDGRPLTDEDENRLRAYMREFF